MRVGVLIDRVIVGGVEKIAINEVIALSRLGHQASLLVLSSNYAPPTGFGDLLKHVNIVHLDERLPRFLRFSFKMPFFSFFSLFHLTYPVFLPFVVKKGEYDFIISHNSYTTITAWALRLTRKIRYGAYVHDPASYIIKGSFGAKKVVGPLLVGLASRLDATLLSAASAVFVQGAEHFEYLKTMLKSPSKLHYIVPGKNAAATLAKTRGDYFLVASSWKAGKGLEDLLPLIAQVQGLMLKIAGTWVQPDYRQKIEAVISQLKLQDSVEILGQVSEEQLDSLYAGARSVIMFSQEKGFGLPVLEASSNGCTFIAPEECGASRYFRNNDDGFFYKFGDNQAVLSHIRELNTDEPKARQMGESSWEQTRTKYSWKSHAETLVSAMAEGAK